jgi:hypothetical protein
MTAPATSQTREQARAAFHTELRTIAMQQAAWARDIGIAGGCRIRDLQWVIRATNDLDVRALDASDRIAGRDQTLAAYALAFLAGATMIARAHGGDEQRRNPLLCDGVAELPGVRIGDAARPP